MAELIAELDCRADRRDADQPVPAALLRGGARPARSLANANALVAAAIRQALDPYAAATGAELSGEAPPWEDDR